MQMKEKDIQESEVIENTFELMLLTLYKTVSLVRLQKKSNYHFHFSKKWYFGEIIESDKMFCEFSGIRQQSEQPSRNDLPSQARTVKRDDDDDGVGI